MYLLSETMRSSATRAWGNDLEKAQEVINNLCIEDSTDPYKLAQQFLNEGEPRWALLCGAMLNRSKVPTRVQMRRVFRAVLPYLQQSGNLVTVRHPPTHPGDEEVHIAKTRVLNNLFYNNEMSFEDYSDNAHLKLGIIDAKSSDDKLILMAEEYVSAGDLNNADLCLGLVWTDHGSTRFTQCFRKAELLRG